MPIGQLQNLCATKFSHWRYEREVRLLVDLHDQRIAGRPDMRFMPLDECLELKKIFMGEKSLHYLESIENALGTKDIPIFQTRAAFSKFAVVLQQDRKYWISRRNRGEPNTQQRFVTLNICVIVQTIAPLRQKVSCYLMKFQTNGRP